MVNRSYVSLVCEFSPRSPSSLPRAKKKSKNLIVAPGRNNPPSVMQIPHAMKTACFQNFGTFNGAGLTTIPSTASPAQNIIVPNYPSGATFTQPVQTNFGNVPRNSFRGPHFADVDTTLFKDVRTNPWRFRSAHRHTASLTTSTSRNRTTMHRTCRHWARL